MNGCNPKKSPRHLFENNPIGNDPINKKYTSINEAVAQDKGGYKRDLFFPGKSKDMIKTPRFIPACDGKITKDEIGNQQQSDRSF